MGVIKAKKTTKKTTKVSKVAKTVTSAVGAVMGGSSKSRGGGRRSHRMTPERLAKKIIILKLKKKLAKLRGY